MQHKCSRTSGHEPQSYVRVTATNGDHDTLAETPTAETATTLLSIASGADENDDDLDNEHEYINTETDKNIESKKRYK